MQFEYLWADGVKVKKPVQLSAPHYISALFEWIEDTLDDKTQFIQEFGAPFPEGFKSTVSNMCKRLFRVYAHVYHHHDAVVIDLGEKDLLNTIFKHFMYFVLYYELVDPRELVPL